MVIKSNTQGSETRKYFNARRSL